MQNIIVASDLSERSRPAVRRAVALGVETGAALTVLFVVSDDLPTELSDPVRIGAESMLTDQITEFTKGQPLSFDVQVKTGDPLEEIDAVVSETEADLLVMGRHRRRKFLDQVRETTVEHLVRSSRVPVLLVASEADGPYRNVLSGVAYSEVCTSALRTIPMIAPKAKVTLFHAHEVSFRQEAERDFETWKTIYGLPSDLEAPIFAEARPRDALDDLMADGDYDLIAIGGHTRADGGRYFVGRFTSGLIRNPPCDLLIAKSGAKRGTPA